MSGRTEARHKPEWPSPLSNAWNSSLCSSSSESPTQDSISHNLTYPVLEIDEDGVAKIVQKTLPSDPIVSELRPKSRAGKSQAENPLHTQSAAEVQDKARWKGKHEEPAMTSKPMAISSLPPSHLQKEEHNPPKTTPSAAPTSQWPPLLFTPESNSEFFILDSLGSDPGLATYTMLPPHADSLTVNTGTGERLFYLTPSATIIRASENRLLHVGYRFGDRVRLKDKKIGATVVRRFVIHGKRAYALIDDTGRNWMTVLEDQIESVLERMQQV
jgi:hypothetical protein